MKPNLKNLLTILVILAGTSVKINAQVTIGMDIPATPGALLDIKEKATSGNELTNSTKGVIYPRVALTSISDLTPLITNATDEQKLQATGMIVFNTTEDNTNNLVNGVYIWNGNQWVLGMGTIGNAIFQTISSNDATINGSYFKGESLKPENSLSIAFNVTSPGKYEISATTSNGYYFMGSGQFPTSGKNVITITGTGVPIESTDELGSPDEISIKINSGNTIIKTNTVHGIPAVFTMNCASISTSGTFKPNVPLTSSEYLTIQLASNSSAIGAKYNLKTDIVNGYSFSATGTISGSKQTVYLYPEIGTQIPLEAGTDYFTISSNSTINTSTCNVSVPIIGPILTINSYGNWYNPQTILKTLATDTKLFSPSGIYKIEGITLSNKLNNISEINNTLNVDGVFITYPNNFSTSTQITNAINFINSGRSMLYARDLGVQSEVVTFLAQVFNTSESSILINNGTSTEQGVFINTDNPIIKGSFGNIAGSYISPDGGGNFSVKINHSDFIPIANTSEGYSRVFMHKTKGLIFIGDGGPYGTNMNWPSKNIFLSNVLAWMADIKGNN